MQELQAIAKEEAAVAGGGAVEAALVDPGKPHINVVFIGHVDHGKSTMSGAILLACGMVNARDVEKLQKDAEAAGRDSWWKAFLLDTNPEERAKGKTQETARSHFQTANKMYTILDAPGHKAFVPSMISGAAQADVAVLVISARTGEFEDGFVKGGQTKEHTMLVRTLGVSHIVVAVNKMDDKTVEWSQSRFDSIQRELNDFLRKAGFKKEQVSFVPLSALTGSGLLERVDPAVCPWYKGEGGAPLCKRPIRRGRLSSHSSSALLETLDAVSRSRDEDPTLPLRIPLLDRYKEAGKVFAMGKVDGGRVKVGDVLVAHPGGHECTVGGLESEFGPLKEARPGDNVTLWLKVVLPHPAPHPLTPSLTCPRSQGIDDNLFHTGYVLCKKGQRQCPVVKRFQAQILVNALPESRPIITSGYQCVMHVHTCTVEVTIDKIVNVLDKKTGKPIKGQAFVRKGSAATVVIECALPAALEKFEGAFFSLSTFFPPPHLLGKTLTLWLEFCCATRILPWPWARS